MSSPVAPNFAAPSPVNPVAAGVPTGVNPVAAGVATTGVNPVAAALAANPAAALAASPTAGFVAAAVPARSRPPRTERRTPFRVPCRVRLVNAATGEVQTVIGETRDISRTGVALHLPGDVPLGTWVETLVPHPNGEPLFLCGKVVHSRRALATGYEVGIATDQPRRYV
jgi:hypothetical protein